MKRVVLVLVLAAIALLIWGDPAWLLHRISIWTCDWLRVFKVC